MSSLLGSWGARALRALPPETAHDMAVGAIGRGLAGGRGADAFGSPLTRAQGFDGVLPHPIGLAAGFDKSARAVGGLLALGFAFVEVGAVTPKPQAGNVKPRLFRLTEDGALINRFGFNNDGMARVEARLADRDRAAGGPLGVNLGANKTSADRIGDFAEVYRRLAPHVEFATVNVSSPNTPGLRDLQSVDALAEILDRIAAVEPPEGSVRPALFVKFAPDGSDEDFADQIAFLNARADVAGLVLTNTTSQRPEGLRGRSRVETGGLSGAPLKAMALERLRHARRRSDGAKRLIGVGGIMTADDAYERVLAGADLLQIYTAFALQGPGVIGALAQGLDRRLKAAGFARLADAVGAAA